MKYINLSEVYGFDASAYDFIYASSIDSQETIDLYQRPELHPVPTYTGWRDVPKVAQLEVVVPDVKDAIAHAIIKAALLPTTEATCWLV